MPEIQAVLVDQTLDFIDSLIRKAKVTIDGVTIEKEIKRSKKSGDTLRKYVYLDVERGLISRAALVDAHDRELYVKNLNYQKGTDGYTITFPIKQRIEVTS